MKEFRKTVLKVVGPRLEEKGFVYDDLNRDLVVFWQKRWEEFFISVGFVDSKLYANRFTIEYFMSKVCTHNLCVMDVPRESSKRIGQLLIQEERKAFLHSSFQNIADVWWICSNTSELRQTLDDLIPIIVKCSYRMDTPELREEIKRSNFLAEELAKEQRIYQKFLQGVEGLPQINDRKVLTFVKNNLELSALAKATISVFSDEGSHSIKPATVIAYVRRVYNTFVRKYQ